MTFKYFVGYCIRQPASIFSNLNSYLNFSVLDFLAIHLFAVVYRMEKMATHDDRISSMQIINANMN